LTWQFGLLWIPKPVCCCLQRNGDMLVHKNIAPKVLPELKRALDSKNVELVGCSETQKIIPVAPARKRTGGQSILTTSCLLK